MCILDAAASTSTARRIVRAVEPAFGQDGLTLDERAGLEWEIAQEAGRRGIRLDSNPGAYDYDAAEDFSRSVFAFVQRIQRTAWGHDRPDVSRVMALGIVPAYLADPGQRDTLTLDEDEV